jgi:hypothetical protein
MLCFASFRFRVGEGEIITNSRDNIAHHFSMHIGQAKVAAGVAEGEFLVVEAEQRKNRLAAANAKIAQLTPRLNGKKFPRVPLLTIDGLFLRLKFLSGVVLAHGQCVSTGPQRAGQVVVENFAVAAAI